VVNRHGGTHPELLRQQLYATLANELNAHFAKEEKVLFLFIKARV